MLLLVEHSITALELYRKLGDAWVDGQIAATLTLAKAFHRMEPSDERVIIEAKDAVKLSHDFGRPISEAAALLVLAQYQIDAGRKEDSLETAQEALAAAEEIGDDVKMKAAQAIMDESSQNKKTRQVQKELLPKDHFIVRSGGSPKPHTMVSFLNFEARVARFSMSKETTPQDKEDVQSVQLPPDTDVLYDLQWTKVTQNLIALPTPLDEIDTS